MNCPHLQDVSTLFDAALPAAEALITLKHLAVCDECADFWGWCERLEKLSERYLSALPGGGADAS